MTSIKRNFGYNIFLTLASYLVSFVLFPYVSRVLGVDNVGRIGFVNNVVSYFSLFAILGIKTLGVREIAACQTREQRSEVFSSLTGFLLISTVFLTTIFLCCIWLVPRFHADKECFIIGASILFFTSFLIEWFYQGLENFKFITIRSIVVRIIYAISVFIFVQGKDDYLLYYALTAGSIIVNAIINFIYSKKFADFSIRNIHFRKYLNPIFSLGLYGIMISMYTTFNTIFLGFKCSETQVGFYYTATKLYMIIIGVFSAFTGVMMPRMSSLIARNGNREFHNKIKNSFDVVLSSSIPIALFFMVLAPQTIMVISGSGYEGSITPMRIIMPTLVLSSMAQIWVIQALIPLKKDKIVLWSSVLGAISGVVLNIILVEKYGAIGTAIVMLSCEVLGNVIGFCYAIYHRLIQFPWKGVIIYAIGSIPYLLCFLLISLLFKSSIIVLILSAFIGGLYFMVFHLFIYKTSFVSQYSRQMISRILNAF